MLVGTPRFGCAIRTTVSFDARTLPPRPSAISGWLSITAACWRSTALWISVPEERRVTTMLSSRPVDTSVSLSPASSISTAA